MMLPPARDHLDVRFPRVRLFDDKESLAKEGARLFLEALSPILDERESVFVILSGGQTPRPLYDRIGRILYTWPPDRRNRIVWVPSDERMVLPIHPESNDRMIRETLVRRAGFPAANLERMRGESPSPEKEALRFEHRLLELFHDPGPHPPEFDWGFLGVGDDGHTASLFPGATAELEHRKLVLSVPETTGRRARLTLSFRLLARSRRLVFVCTGERKRAILKKILVELYPCPVQDLLTLHFENERVPEFWVDRDAYDSALDRITLRGSP
jgi:6-phosphogluconolactonase